MITWIASYPRSGNTFLRIILNKCFGVNTYSIYNDLNDIGKDISTSDIVGHKMLPDDFSIEKARQSKKEYFIKTHEMWSEEKANDKFIYLIRDGREVSISVKKYHEQFLGEKYNNIDIIRGITGSWIDHINSWKPLERDNCLLIKFEEITEEPSKYIDIISNFINEKPISYKLPKFNELHSVNPKFFRSGKKKSWQTLLSNFEKKYFIMKNMDIMKRYGYWDENCIKELKEIKSDEKSTDFIKNIINKSDSRIKILFYEKLQLAKKNDELKKKNDELEKRNNELKREINDIYDSIHYKIMNAIIIPVKRMYNKIK